MYDTCSPEARVCVGVAQRLVQRADQVEVLFSSPVVEECLASECLSHVLEAQRARVSVDARVTRGQLEHVERRSCVSFDVDLALAAKKQRRPMNDRLLVSLF